MFKRRKSADDSVEVTEEVAESSEAAPASEATPTSGPYDISDAPEDEIARIDLGGLQIPIVDNMQLHLEGHDEEANTFAIAVIVLEEQQSALQLMAVAAPRSGGFWAEVMGELETEIQGAGGQVARREGRFGDELFGQVPAQDAEGNRWFIRGMFMGAAVTDPGLGEFFEDIMAGCVVNRGERPMAPGDLIPLTPPSGIETEEVEADDDEQGEYEDLRPFERGPEITETR